MKKILLSMAAVSTLAMAAPAAAQYSNGGYQNQSQNNGYANGNIAVRIDELQARLQAGVQSGAISRQEAITLREQLRQLTRLERLYSRNGLTGQERSELQQRLRTLRQQIRMAEGQRGGWNSNDRMDQNRDGWDDRDLNRDGRIDNREMNSNDRWDDDDRRDNGRWDNDRRDDDRWDDDRRDDDDRYEDNRRGGIGGIIDNVLGGGGLRVGQRVSGNLGSVPYEYRNQYRDGNGVYYRSDGRRIYQIDARTETVLRIYSMNR